ncbi:ABC transporter permease subunit [uncultured Clostridium sp.]|uniref:ABC transporter permease subunit n=1 Tax=uncultured Clostridium sp. TaxID=59620 RepID=UPI0028E753EA|nr:ABC transporter permease [uncultured Clostridium sp.]
MNNDLLKKVNKVLFDNIVTILFVILCLVGIKLSGQPLSFVLDELMARVARNSFLVLALIIPVIAGMGLNFGIVIGAMAGQIAVIAVTHWNITEIKGFLLCVLISTPLAIIFGYLTGKLLNKTKGQEMIASMILGFVANGLYQFLFLFLVGTLIPMKNPVLVLSGGIGIKNTVDLKDTIKYSLDNLLGNLFKLSMYEAVLIALIIIILYNLYKIIRQREQYIKRIVYLSLSVSIIILIQILPKWKFTLKFINVPIVTMLVIALLCLFNIFIVKTKLGQDMRTVGHSMQVANASGIKVNKVRIIAIIMSTVLGAWGQLIFLQNIGTLNTYGSHEQVGMFAIAALLIGGASVSKATNGQAILGVILFHTLFIVSPMAGKNLFDNPQIGEYFRVFVAYGVIGLSLGLHAWKKQVSIKSKSM